MKKLVLIVNAAIFMLCTACKLYAVPLNASTCVSAVELTTLKQSAEKDDLYAMRKLFTYYASCVGDKNEALFYAKRRAEIGTAQDVASYATAIESDEHQSFVWFLKAAQMGNSRAKLRVAEDYRDGTGTTKNLDQALLWFQLGATCQEYGIDDMEEFAQFLISFKQIPLSNVKALAWLDVVAEENSMSLEGKKAREKLLVDLTKHEVDMAETLANEFTIDSGCVRSP